MKMKRDKNEKRCQCSTCTETPTQQSATTQDQHHAQGLALCHDVTLDIVTHRWVPAGHPQYTGAREGRLWVAQAQTQLTLFVDPQSLSLECEHGSGAEGSKCSLDQGPSPNLFISTVLDETANAGHCRQAASRRRCESDPQSHKETTSMLNEKRSEKLTDEEMDGMIQRLTLTVVSVKRRTVKEIVEVVRSIPQKRILGTNRRADRGRARAARSRQLKQ